MCATKKKTSFTVHFDPDPSQDSLQLINRSFIPAANNWAWGMRLNRDLLVFDIYLQEPDMCVSLVLEPAQMKIILENMLVNLKEISGA